MWKDACSAIPAQSRSFSDNNNTRCNLQKQHLPSPTLCSFLTDPPWVVSEKPGVAAWLPVLGSQTTLRLPGWMWGWGRFCSRWWTDRLRALPGTIWIWAPFIHQETPSPVTLPHLLKIREVFQRRLHTRWWGKFGSSLQLWVRAAKLFMTNLKLI